MLDAAPHADHALQQDPAFRSALKLCGQTPLSLPCGLIVLSRRILGVPVAMLPRAVPPPDLQAQLDGIGLTRTPLILSPEVPCDNLNAIRLGSPTSTAVIDLTADTSIRRATLHAKWRNQLRKAEGGPLRVRSAALRSDHPILQLEEDQARARGYANWPRGLSVAFCHAAPDQTRLFTAYLAGAPVSHMLFLRHGCRATYHIGHSSSEGRAHNAHNLLLWTATCWLARAGHTTLDLGLLHRDTPTLNRFKLRAGARPQVTGGTWLRWRPFARKMRPAKADL